MAKKNDDSVRLAESIFNGVPAPDLAELAQHFFSEAGGVQAVAKVLYDEFSSAKPGSLARARIIDVILRITKTAQEKLGKDDLGMLSMEDLKAQFKQIVHVGATDGDKSLWRIDRDGTPGVEGASDTGGDVAAECGSAESVRTVADAECLPHVDGPGEAG